MKTKEAVQNILRHHDPVGLIARGAPDDEYDYIADKLVSLCAENGDEGKLADSLYKTFVSLFDEGLAGEKSKYLAIAKDLLA